MRQFKTLWKGMAAALAGGLLLCACSSEEDSLEIPEGKGYVKLSLYSETGFQTKASEGGYKDINNYTVQILQNDAVVDDNEFAYSEMPDFIELANGSYNFKAFYGEDKAVYAGADTLNLYFSDEDAFTLKGDTATINLTCEPNSARINVVFAESMDTYFSDYKVIISTIAQNGSVYPWTKTTEGPVYFKVNNQESVKFTIELTPKTGTNSEPKKEVSYTLSPKDAKTINISATSNSGNLGITIKIDKTVIEHPVDIDIPSDWVE